MSKQATYQVKFRITAIIGISVDAFDMDDAAKKANIIQNKNVFVKGIECIDEKTDFIGVDNLDLWEIR